MARTTPPTRVDPPQPFREPRTKQKSASKPSRPRASAWAAATMRCRRPQWPTVGSPWRTRAPRADARGVTTFFSFQRRGRGESRSRPNSTSVPVQRAFVTTSRATMVIGPVNRIRRRSSNGPSPEPSLRRFGALQNGGRILSHPGYCWTFPSFLPPARLSVRCRLWSNSY